MRRSRVVWGAPVGAQMNLYLNYHRPCGFATEPFKGESSSAQKELWKCRVRGKRGKPNPGFSRFPPPLGNLANPARFPHSHSSGGSRLGKWKTKIRFPTFPHATRDDDDYLFRKVKIKVKTQNQSRRLPAGPPVGRPRNRNPIRKETLAAGGVSLSSRLILQ